MDPEETGAAAVAAAHAAAKTFVPRIQAYTWVVFLPVFVAALTAGQLAGWLKTNTYLNLTASRPHDAEGRYVFIYTLYAYAYAYSRILLGVLTLCLLIIVLRYAIVLLPQENRVMASIAGHLYRIFDARNVCEFLHVRHWRAHGAGFALYLGLTIALTMVLFGSKDFAPEEDPARAKRETARQYTRVTIATSTALVAFYVAYAARMIKVSSPAA